MSYTNSTPPDSTSNPTRTPPHPPRQGDGNGTCLEVWRYTRKISLEGLNVGNGWSFELAIQVPLLGGAMWACTWHFFYIDPSLEVLVVLQAFLTVAGNCTMWATTYRIWKASQEKSPAK